MLGGMEENIIKTLKDNFYNNIAYFIFTIGFILMLTTLLSVSNLINFEYKYSGNILGICAFGCGEIYRRLRTVPITEAITNYWKYKIKKQNKNTAQDYASFKKEENTNDK